MEKDGLIEAYYRHGRFPADKGAHKTRDGHIVRGAGHIETEIKSNYWYEFLQIFAPVGLLALVLYVFYNALPVTNKQNVSKKAQELQQTQMRLENQQPPMYQASNVSADHDSMLAKAMTKYAHLSKNPSVQKVVELPELTQKGLKKEAMKHQPAIDTILTQKNALQDLKTRLPAPRVSPPSQPSNQANRKTNCKPSNPTPATIAQQKSGQNKTKKPVQKLGTLPKSSSQKPIPLNSAAAKPSPAKTAPSRKPAFHQGA